MCARCGNFQMVQQDVCIECGEDPKFPLIILNFSQDALLYGYRYRLRYEAQVKRYGSVRVMYSLPDSHEVLAFLATAVLGGIVGNISTDAFKSICANIKKIILPIKENKDFEELLTVLEKEDKVMEFYEYVQAYYHDMPMVNREVMIALREERLANAVENIMAEDPRLSAVQALRIARMRPDNYNMHSKPSRKDIEGVLDKFNDSSH